MQNANIQFRFIYIIIIFFKTIHDAIVNYDLHDGKAIVGITKQNNAKKQPTYNKNINT